MGDGVAYCGDCWTNNEVRLLYDPNPATRSELEDAMREALDFFNSLPLDRS